MRQKKNNYFFSSAELMLRSPAATRRLGRKLGAALQPGDFVALTGDLGAGKTLLVKAAAEGAGVSEPATSPSFALVNVYRGGRVPLRAVRLGLRRPSGRARRHALRVGGKGREGPAAGPARHHARSRRAEDAKGKYLCHRRARPKTSGFARTHLAWSMPDWITCPQCGLKHSKRDDGLCPKCMNAVGVGVPAKPLPGETAAEAGDGVRLAPEQRDDVTLGSRLAGGVLLVNAALLVIEMAVTAGGRASTDPIPSPASWWTSSWAARSFWGNRKRSTSAWSASRWAR
jgi:hypothetical protein